MKPLYMIVEEQHLVSLQPIQPSNTIPPQTLEELIAPQ